MLETFKVFVLIVKLDKEVQNHMMKIKNVGLFKTIQNDLIKCIAGCVSEFVISEIKNLSIFFV